MPWDANYKKYTPPTLPAEWHAPLPDGVSERDPQAHAQRAREYAAEWEWKKRFVVELAEVPRYCPRKACKRSRACVSPKVACYDEAEDLLREIFFPRLKAALKADKRRRELAGGSPPSITDPGQR
jgi:hypothetical protein